MEIFLHDHNDTQLQVTMPNSSGTNYISAVKPSFNTTIPINGILP